MTFVQKVPADAEDWFLEWRRGISAVAESFAGYEGTDLYQPTVDSQNEWVTVMHFADEPSLEAWLSSSVRAEWVAKLRAKIGDFRATKLAGGFSQWFAKATVGEKAETPSWKMALMVLLALYPTATLLTIAFGPLTAKLGMAESTLVRNILSVAILQWLLMPVLNSRLAFWLKANGSRDKATSIGGFVAITTLLLLICAVFHFTVD